MWVRDKDENGKHRFTVYNSSNEIYAQQGGFDCHTKCERMAEIEQRHCLFGYPKAPSESIPASIDNISDEDLLSALSE